MQFRIIVGDNVSPRINREFSNYIFDRMKRDLHKLVKHYHKKYEVREKYILKSSLIKWKGKVPSHLDLPYYIENCLILSYVQGTYVIRINPKQVIKGSLTPVKLLIKMLEYGTTIVPAFPMLRRLFRWYSENYLNLLPEFMEERMNIL